MNEQSSIDTRNKLERDTKNAKRMENLRKHAKLKGIADLDSMSKDLEIYLREREPIEIECV